MRSSTFPILGDAERTVDALLRVIDQPQPPLRLALGSTAYSNIHAALNKRLQVLDAHKDDAFYADKVSA